MVRKLVRQATRSPFIRNAAVLTAGSFAAQMIPLLMLPLFARMFAASTFGIQALLQAGMVLIVPLATGCYELAIPTPKEEGEARALATLAVRLTLAVSLLTLLVIALLRARIVALLHIPEIGGWVFAYPAIVLGTALTSVANYWLLRDGRYGLQSVNKLALAIATSVVTLGCGLLHWPGGLLVGFVAGILLAAAFSLMQARRRGLRLGHPKHLGALAKRYGHYPFFGSIPTAINNIAMQLPLLIITATYSLSVAGHYAVARNTLAGGVALIALCIGQVVLKHVSVLVHDGRPVWPDFRRIALWLALFAACLTAGIYVVAPWFLRVYLGSAWADSATIMRTLAFTSFFWLMGPTLSLGVVAIQKIRVVAAWQVAYGVIELGLFFFVHLPFGQFLWRVVAFEVVSYGLYTVLMIVTIYRYDRSRAT
ncbi:MAG: oligosaccharide flippase family protein [Alphaproteobacteria bacterium]